MTWQTVLLAAGVVLWAAIQYGLAVHALRDLARRPRVRGENKVVWALVILGIPIAGALVYTIYGPTSFIRRDRPRPPRLTQAPDSPIISEGSALDQAIAPDPPRALSSEVRVPGSGQPPHRLPPISDAGELLEDVVAAPRRSRQRLGSTSIRTKGRPVDDDNNTVMRSPNGRSASPPRS